MKKKNGKQEEVKPAHNQISILNGTLIGGIDPGANGAISTIKGDQIGSYKLKNEEVDIVAHLVKLKNLGVSKIYVEHVHATPT